MPEICHDNSENIYSDGYCGKRKTYTHPLKHVEYDFYNKSSDLLVAQVYVKEIKKDSLDVTFQESAVRVLFKTSSKQFLKLYQGTSEETIFDWHVKLRHGINCSQSNFTVSKTKLTLELNKKLRNRWTSLEALNNEGATDAEENGRSMESSSLNGFTNGLQDHTDNDCNDRDTQYQKNNDNAKSSNTSDSILVITDCTDGDYGSFSSDKIVDKEDDLARISSSKLSGSKTNDEKEFEPSNCIDDETYHKSVYTNSKTDYRTTDGSNSCSDGITYTQSESGTINLANTCQSTTARTDNGLDSKYDNSGKQNEVKLPSRELHRFSDDSSDPTNCGSIHLKDISSEESTASDKSSFKNKALDQASKDSELRYDAKVHDCRPGSTGLANNVNMCYINSIVQCLSAVKELRTYLLCKKHCANINGKNKHGFGGDLVNSFGLLIEDLWSGKKCCSSAIKLKNILGRKHKHFTHHGQGDAQEFLTFLLDGCHEDLKNEKKENIVDDRQAGWQEDITELGQKYWKKYASDNQSIIVDLFHGQTMSEIRCRRCGKPSVQFDPMMQLNLPIPDSPKCVSIYVFFQDPTKKPVQVKLLVCQGTRCGELLVQISKLVDIPANQLMLLCPYYRRIAHIYDPMDELSSFSVKEYLVACQLEVCRKGGDQEEKKNEDFFKDTNSRSKIPDGYKLHVNDGMSGYPEMENKCDLLYISVIQRSTHRIIEKCSFCSVEKVELKHCSRCCRVAYCNRDCQRKHWKSHRSYCSFEPDVIGCPFILTVHSSEATVEQLKKKALQYARFSVEVKEGELENRQFQLRLLENLTDFRSKGKTLVQKGDAPVVQDNVCIAMDWESTSRNKKMRSIEITCDNHESVNSTFHTEDNSCSLEECLKLYWNPETITRETGWRCDHCKDVRAAVRKTAVFRHPKNLIIHIKRFSYAGNGRKIRKDVRFPLRGLDMSPFTFHQTPSDAIYDLHAVCSHHGVMNFGHYITYSKPYSPDELSALGLAGIDGWVMYDDHKVSYITESNVEKAEAYILFYQWRDGNATSLREPAPLPASVSPHLFGATRCKTSDRDLVNGNKDPLTLTHTEIQTQQDYTNDPFSFKQTYPECGCKRGESGPSTCGSVNAEEEIPQEDELD